MTGQRLARLRRHQKRVRSGAQGSSWFSKPVPCSAGSQYPTPNARNKHSKQKRPAPFARGRVSSAIATTTTTSNIKSWNFRRRSKSHPAPPAGNVVTEHDWSSIRQSLARRLPDSVMRGLCRRGPCPSRGLPRGLNLTRRTMSASTTVADLIGDLAALHHHFVRGRVVGSGFYHSE